MRIFKFQNRRPPKQVEHIHDVPSALRVCNGPESLVAAVGQLNSVNLLLPSNLEAQKMLTLISRTSHTGFLIRFNGFFYDPGIELILKARPKLLL